MPRWDPALLRRPDVQALAFTALLWAMVAGLLVAAWPVLLPFVLAGLAAYVIDPLIVRLTRLRVAGHHLPRGGAVALVYGAQGLLLWLAAVTLVPRLYRELARGLLEARALAQGLTPERIEALAGSVNELLQQYRIPVDVIASDGWTPGHLRVDLAAQLAHSLDGANRALQASIGDLLGLSQALLGGTLRALVFAILLFMLTAFISMDAPRILRFLPTLAPSTWRPAVGRLIAGIDAGLAGVVRGQVTIMLINGALTLIGLLVLRVPFAFALSALAALLYAVPIFGSIISTVPIVALGLTRGVETAALALGWILGIHALETYVLNPKILGDATRIHPVLIVLALVIGERSAGITGAVLAVPVMSVVVAVFRFLHRQLSLLDERAVAGHDQPEAPTDEPKGRSS